MNGFTFLKRNYQTLNKIEISKAALLHNYAYLSGLERQVAVAPVLKSNAYGHGLKTVAKILDTTGAPFFCVDSLYEAYELLKINIKTPILIMGYTSPENLKVKKLPFSFAVYDRQTVSVLHTYQRDVKVHVFVDTGMNREGIALSELPKFLDYCKNLKNIRIDGLMSHFAASDHYQNSKTQEQVKNLQAAQKMFTKAGIKPEWVHIGNSAACLLPEKYKGKIGNLVRAGIATYGIGGEIDDANLHPVMRVVTTLVQIKKIQNGEQVGYDFTFSARKDMTIGLLPYGYYDGLDRRLSNKGYVQINGIFCPIIGRVSMNITTVDISNVLDARVGQEVFVFSNIPEDRNSFYTVANLTGTIQRDLLVHLSESTRRVIIS